MLAMKTSKKLIFSACLLAPILLLSAQASHAASATWNLNPGSGDWQTATNWTPITVPNGPADTATFALSNTTGVSLSATAAVDGIVFNSGASAFTIAVSPTFILDVNGAGMANNSGITQNFVNNADASGRGEIIFHNNATAGSSANTYTGNGRAIGLPVSGGRTTFFNTSTAGNALFIDNGGTGSGGSGGRTFFSDSSTAGNSTVINNRGVVSGANGGGTSFLLTSSAGNSTFTNNGGQGIDGGSGNGRGFAQFLDTSTAGSATFSPPLDSR